MNATLMPTNGARWLRNEVDRLLDRMSDNDGFATAGEWVPRMDVSETPDEVKLRIEIPGIDPKDIQLLLENDVLTIRGEKHEEAEQKTEEFVRSERTYGKFARSMKLPAPVDPEKVSAIFKNGVLAVAMPKSAMTKGTKIPIKTI
jgi:HSP20 family protein